MQQQMQRDLEIHAGIVTELRRLLGEARDELADTQERLERAEALRKSAKTRERRYRRRLAAAAPPTPAAVVAADAVAALDLNEVKLYLRYLGYPVEYLACGPRDLEWMTVLYNRLRTHTRLLGNLPDPLQEGIELGWLHGACPSDLSVQMWSLAPYELLPVPPYALNPEEEDAEVERDRELNAMKYRGELSSGGAELWREFLIRWRHYHKRLPNQHAADEAMRLQRWGWN